MEVIDMSIEKQKLYNEIETLPEELTKQVVNFIEYLKLSYIDTEAPESVMIKSKQDLKEKLQKGIDDIKANRVYSSEEIFKRQIVLQLSIFCVVKITQGGAVAAPVAGQILGEVLPYLELKEDNEETKINNEIVIVPDIKYKTLKEAETILKENGLKIKYDTEEEKINKEEKIISSQIPSGGITINKDSTVTVTIE